MTTADDSASSHDSSCRDPLGRMNETCLSGDPFTRLLRPGRQATAFQDSTEGQVNAIGLQLAPAPGNRLQVGLVLQSSPALAAGIRPGDEVLEINGLDVQDKSRQ